MPLPSQSAVTNSLQREEVTDAVKKKLFWGGRRGGGSGNLSSYLSSVLTGSVSSDSMRQTRPGDFFRR